jgi:multidrug efflux pump subunit AcrB
MSVKDTLMKGPVAWMAGNRVAANLLMFVLFVGGFLGLMRVKQEVFPEFSTDVVAVTVAYPGASPSEVEQGVVRSVEEALMGVDGVKRVNATAAEGVGTITAELLIDADQQLVLADIKTEVDRITSFPDDAEEPQVRLAAASNQVVSLVIAGDQDLGVLHDIAEDARAELLALEGVTKVELAGVPPLEMAIEIPRESLDAYGLTLDQIAAQVGAASTELPGGEIETLGGEVLVRVSDRALTSDQFEDLPIRGANGAEVRLGDLGTARDSFADNDQSSYFNGQPAVRLTVYRVGDETPTSVSDAVKAYLPDLEAKLPPEIQLAVWSDDSEMLADRIDLLIRNARLGLLLVLVILALFLDLRLAFWVGLGIPITFLGTFALMPSMDVSVNMVTLFAFIITLGLVVDDAIVVGENAFKKREEGLPPLQAAVSGAKEMVMPVTFAILTTVAAFGPLFVVPGFIGKIFRMIPMITVTVLAFSLIESFFILPAHLAHETKFFDKPIFKPLNWAREKVSGALQRFIHGPFDRALSVVLENRIIAAGVAFGVFAVTIGAVASGTVPFSFFPKLEADQVVVSARLPYGASEQSAQAVRQAIESSLDVAVSESGDAEIVEGMFTSMGSAVSGGGPGGGSSETGGHLITIEAALVPSDDRELSSAEFSALWAAATPELVGVEALVFSSSSGPGAGAAVDIQLSHTDEAVLAEAAAYVEGALRGFDDLSDVENTYASGKPQLDYVMRPEAQQLDLSAQDVARQIRASFFGSEALREQRGRNQVKVMVRLPPEQRSSEYDLERLRIRSPAGGFVPLGTIASFERGQAPTSIKRTDGARVINVRGELAPGAVSPQKVLNGLDATVFPELEKRYPNLKFEMAGSQREQGETFSSLGPNYLMALFAIYALLAIPFRSFLQPAVIMSAIPFGFVGAVFGHLVMGYPLSIISFLGIVALTGVVVNDSLVLMDAANRFRKDGHDALAAIRMAAKRRFRPILLTSLTTFFGLLPMLAETSPQARFLIPMAISLGFGVLFATVIVLVLIPSFYLLLEDAQDVSVMARDWVRRKKLTWVIFVLPPVWPFWLVMLFLARQRDHEAHDEEAQAAMAA